MGYLIGLGSAVDAAAKPASPTIADSTNALIAAGEQLLISKMSKKTRPAPAAAPRAAAGSNTALILAAAGVGLIVLIPLLAGKRK